MQTKRKIVAATVIMVGLIAALAFAVYYFWLRPAAQLYEVTRTPDAYFSFVDAKRVSIRGSYGGVMRGVEVSWRLERAMPPPPVIYFIKLTAYAENGTSRTQGVGSSQSISEVGYVFKSQYSYDNLRLFPEAVYAELYHTDDLGNLVSDVVRINLKAI